MNYLPEVVQAVPGEGDTVYAYFSDGTVRQANIKPLIERGGIFAPLADREFFEGRLTVMNHAVAWDVTGDRDPSTCIDLDPVMMYESSPVVSDLPGACMRTSICMQKG